MDADVDRSWCPILFGEQGSNVTLREELERAVDSCEEATRFFDGCVLGEIREVLDEVTLGARSLRDCPIHLVARVFFLFRTRLSPSRSMSC